VVAVVLLLYLRWYLTGKQRETRFALEDTNAAALHIWRYASRLDRQKAPPEELEDIALKARCSQHRISEDERAVMINYALQLSEDLYRARRLPGRLWLRYIWLV
jgi:hypothetical protein